MFFSQKSKCLVIELSEKKANASSSQKAFTFVLFSQNFLSEARLDQEQNGMMGRKRCFPFSLVFAAKLLRTYKVKMATGD